MARLLGPDMGSRAVYMPSGAPATNLPGVVYSDPAGINLASIGEFDPDNPTTPGATISGSEVTTDGHGMLPYFWFPEGVDRVWVSVYGGPLTPVDADNNSRFDRTVSGISPEWFGARGDGTSDDITPLQAAVDAAEASYGTVYLRNVVYRVSSPIVVPPNVTLQGQQGLRVYTTGSDAPPVATIKATSGFTGAGIIRLVDREIGGYSVDSSNQRLRYLNIDGSAASGSVAGIHAQGRVHDVMLDQVWIYRTPGNGVTTTTYTRADTSTTFPYSWTMTSVTVQECANNGFSLGNLTDTTLISCEAIGVHAHGFILTGCSNSHLAGCRAEFSGARGFSITGAWGTGVGSGGVTLVGCSTDRSNSHGISVDATGSAPIIISGAMLRRDGDNSNAGGGNLAALWVSGATMPVVVDGLTVYPGVDDGGAGTNSPQYGISVTGSTYVSVDNAYVHAATTPIHDGGSNSVFTLGPSIGTATGTTASPTRATTYTWSPSSSLDVRGRALGQPQPRDHNVVAWTFDPAIAGTSNATTNGTIYLSALYIPRPVSVTTVYWSIGTIATTPTAGQNWIGLYSPAGAKLAETDVSTSTSSGTGLKTTTLASTALTPGWYWVAMLFNAATPPTVHRGGALAASTLNVGLTAATARYALGGTSHTTLPASITPGSNATSNVAWWIAVA